jgi:hypothetical protein
MTSDTAGPVLGRADFHSMSAKIIPWRPRPSVTAQKPTEYLPALIDGQVTVHALMEGLAAVGLQLQHDPVTGKFIILAR